MVHDQSLQEHHDCIRLLCVWLDPAGMVYTRYENAIKTYTTRVKQVPEDTKSCFTVPREK